MWPGKKILQRRVQSKCVVGPEVGPQFFTFDIGMALVDERIYTVMFAKETSVVLPVLLIGDFRIQSKEGREEAILVGVGVG